MAKNGAQILIDALLEQGVEYIFGIPGAPVLALFDELYKRAAEVHPHAPRAGRRPHGRRLRPRHRQGRRLPRHQRPRRHQPGHRPRHRQHGLRPDGRHHRPGPDRPDRQRRLPGGRHHRHHPPDHQAQLPGQGRRATWRATIREAFHIARTGRPGPVLVDLPVDVTVGKCWTASRTRHATCPATSRASRATPARSSWPPRRSTRPSGPSSTSAAASSSPAPPRSCATLAEKAQHPRHHHAAGPGRLRRDATRCPCGMLGMHGTAYANYAVQDCDLLIAVGARFDDRVTGKRRRPSPRTAKIIHIDIDPASITKNVRGRHPRRRRRQAQSWPSCCTLVEPRDADAPGCSRSPSGRRSTRSATSTAPTARQAAVRHRGDLRRSPAATRSSPPDVGQHQMWTAQFYTFTRPRAVPHLRRAGHDGLRLPGGHRRAVRPARARPSSTSTATAPSR